MDKYMLILDYDDVDLGFVQSQIGMLRRIAKLGKAVVYESRAGQDHYLVAFPDSVLSREEVNLLMSKTESHIGHIRFTRLVGEACMRMSKKPMSEIEAPKVVALL